MKVKIDPDLCTGCEDCTEACPALFRLGPDWIAVPVVDTVPPGLESEAVNMADLCQFEAIRIEND
ncbi:MAG: ferredoxin [Kiritimatiellia bacterium]